MFDIFIRHKTIHIDCFTARTDVFAYAPIVNASECLPAWWKNLPKEYHNPNVLQPLATMKTCRGFIDEYKNSIIIPMWSDFLLKFNNAGGYQWQFADTITTAATHNRAQRGEYLPNYDHLKIDSPWLFKSNDSTPWSFGPSFYNFDSLDDFHLMPGTVDFKYQHDTNINILFNKSFNVEFRQPLIRLRPYTEKNVSFKTHLISETEFKQLKSIGTTSTFINKYVSHKKAAESNKDSRCPFHSILKK